MADEPAIEQRLRAVEDQRSILDTIYQYCHSLDYGLEDDWLDCFTDSAVWDWQIRDDVIAAALEAQGLPSKPVRVEGIDKLRQMVKGHTRPPERWHKHTVSNTRISLDGDRATAASYFVRVDASLVDSSAYIRAFGRYLDTLVRCTDGKWRIEERRCELEAHVDEWMLTGCHA
jgi:3-phenylpropionate/cinnamic acid dioxygenase small subunit